MGERSSKIKRQIYQNYTRLLARDYESQKIHKCQPRLLYPAKLSITIDGEAKVSNDKNKFIQHLSTNPALQRKIKGKLQHTQKDRPGLKSISHDDGRGH